MKTRPHILAALGALLAAGLACNLPSAAPATPNAQQTLEAAAAQTLQVLLSPTSPAANLPSPTPNLQPSATFPPLSTNTPAPTVTVTPIPCNRAQFVSDVSIPDGTNIKTGAAFTKTWRLKNNGSCTWTSSYQLIFDKGDQMSGPLTQPLLGNVAPGQEVDISVNLIAPAAAGTYKGYWQLRDQNGVLFGLSGGSFWVDIRAVLPTSTPTATFTATVPAPVSQTIALPLVSAESGSVRSDGTVYTFVNVGDTDDNKSQQGFVSFDLSALPAGATITDVKVNFGSYDTLGSPFDLGCLRLYPQTYGSVDAADFTGGSPLGAVARWCSAAELSNTAFPAPDMLSTLQSAVGTSRATFRLQFNDNATNNNASADMARFGASLQVIVTYTQP
jgi:hypothetical protein